MFSSLLEMKVCSLKKKKNQVLMASILFIYFLWSEIFNVTKR